MPADEDPVRLFTRVDAVSHLAVEIDQVFRSLRAQLDQVEVDVAPDERVGRPLHDLDLTRKAPAPLVLLELEPETPGFAVWQDAKDVRVHEEAMRWRAAEPAHEAGDHAAIRKRA